MKSQKIKYRNILKIIWKNKKLKNCSQKELLEYIQAMDDFYTIRIASLER